MGLPSNKMLPGVGRSPLHSMMAYANEFLPEYRKNKRPYFAYV